mgnify:CR=1 FL=1
MDRNDLAREGSGNVRMNINRHRTELANMNIAYTKNAIKEKIKHEQYLLGLVEDNAAIHRADEGDSPLVKLLNELIESMKADIYRLQIALDQPNA